MSLQTSRGHREDSKLANIIKPVCELSEKLDNLIQRPGTVEQWVSDLEDESATMAPWVKALEGQLQRVTDRLESFKNQSRRQNVRIVGTEGKSPVALEKWILEVLNIQTNRIKLERAHHTKSTASVLTNGLLSASFKVKRGTAQGSLLSPILFSLAIEPLALAISQKPRYSRSNDWHETT